MIFNRKWTVKRRAARQQAEKTDALETLLAEFRDAPIPASQTDWQDLQRRIASRRMAQTPRRNATRTRAKIAFAACAAVVLLAAGTFRDSFDAKFVCASARFCADFSPHRAAVS